MASKQYPRIRTYQNQLKKLLREPVVDFILFGSAVKGGIPHDIDVAVIVRSRDDGIPVKENLRAIFGEKADIQIVTIETLYSSLWLTLLKEGFSVREGQYLFELYRIKPVVLYKYSIKELSSARKVGFYRGLRKLVGDQGEVLGRSVILVPITLKNELMEFFKSWSVYYETREYELIPMLRKEEFV